MSKKYTARMRVSFSVHYDLAIPTDNPNPSDAEILDKLCDVELFTQTNWSSVNGSDATFGLNTAALEGEGITVEAYDYYSDPEATGKERLVRDWEISIDKNGDNNE